MRLFAALLIIAGIALLTWGCFRINTTFGLLFSGSLLGASGLGLAQTEKPKPPTQE